MVLILAYGNSLRRDDGAGFILADMVERMFPEAGFEVDRVDSHQLEPELAIEIANEKVSAVLFIDTRIVEMQDETVPDFPTADQKLSEAEVSCPRQSNTFDLVAFRPRVQFRQVFSAESESQGMGHHLNVSTLLAYARHLFNKEPPAWLITVPGVDFGHGEGISEIARNAIDASPEILKELIGLIPHGSI